MTRKEFLNLMNNGPLFLDGATGSNLRATGMPVGVSAEAWILEHPDAFIGLQRAYVDAGSMAVCAPSFGANRLTLGMYGLQDRVDEFNHRLVALSKQAAQGRALVMGDMSPTGKPLDVEGGVSYDEALGAYREQAGALLDAGVDLFIIETMLSVTECCAAIEAVRSLSADIPVFCTLTLDAVGGAYFDGDAGEAAEQLPAVGADAVGMNCGQGPELYTSVIERMRALTSVPVIAKPNAGMPEILSDGSARYAMTPTRFAREMRKLQLAGANILGGCCGTTPEHIRAMVELCGKG